VFSKKERETYAGTLEVSPAAAGGEKRAVKFRMLHELGLGRGKAKGRKRKALEPAINAQRTKFEPVIASRNREIFNAKL